MSNILIYLLTTYYVLCPTTNVADTHKSASLSFENFLLLYFSVFELLVFGGRQFLLWRRVLGTY